MAIGVVIFLLTQDEKGLALNDLFSSSLVFCFGVIFLLTPLFGKRNFVPEEVRFNIQDESICFQIGFPDNLKKLNYSFGAFKKIFIEKVIQSSKSGSRSRFLIYLVKYDGSFYWIDSLNSAAELEEKMKILLSVISLPIEDKTDIGIKNSNPKEYVNRQETIPTLSASKYLRIEKQSGDTNISILKIYSFVDKIFLFLISYLFLGIPFYIVFRVLLEGIVAFTFFALSFNGIFVIIVSTFFLTMTRKISMKLDPFGLKVFYKYPIFFSYFNTEKNIDRGEIKYIQVHKLETGGYWLTILLSVPTKPSDSFTIKNMLKDFHIGAFPSGILSSSEHSLVGLWQLGYSPDKTFTGFDDLLYLEKYLQEELNIIE